jgi:hypothetical protein
MTEFDSANGSSPANHRGLYALVITLGVLILLAFGALIGGLLLGVGSESAAGGTGPYLVSVPAPAGARIAETELDGNRIVLRLEGGGESVVIVEATTGRIIGRIELDHAP